jgi:aerobic-type carbon monoxide dehydrogenase small subunit (CoxS/CutS family)
VNRLPVELVVPTHRTLLEVLREDLALTGTKHGCELGECGACTVLVEGKPELACLRLAAACDGAEITTVEGLARGPALDPLQAAFADTGAAQRGYCTPGMLLVAHELLERNPAPSREEIRLAISGNLCRCTGYLRIVEAIERAADVRRNPLRHPARLPGRARTLPRPRPLRGRPHRRGGRRGHRRGRLLTTRETRPILWRSRSEGLIPSAPLEGRCDGWSSG